MGSYALFDYIIHTSRFLPSATTIRSLLRFEGSLVSTVTPIGLTATPSIVHPCSSSFSCRLLAGSLVVTTYSLVTPWEGCDTWFAQGPAKQEKHKD